MHAYIIRRLLQSIVVCLGISIIAFSLMHLAGDPATLLLPVEVDQEDIDLMRKNLGLDRPVYEQYWRFLKGMIKGDFGNSLFMQQDALSLVLERLPATVELTVAGMALALTIAIPLGILSAIKRYSVLDNLTTMGADFGQAMPIFWLGIMLIIIFLVHARLLPAGGKGGGFSSF